MSLIFFKLHLYTSVCGVFQVRVLASDGGTPPRTDTTVVLVNVQRNLRKPEFDPREYTAQIMETQSVGVPFVQVRGRDRDQKVIKLSKKDDSVGQVATWPTFYPLLCL